MIGVKDAILFYLTEKEKRKRKMIDNGSHNTSTNTTGGTAYSHTIHSIGTSISTGTSTKANFKNCSKRSTVQIPY